MPFKHNASRRHHIETMKFRVSNWREYEAGLRRRGSLTLWVTPQALSKWQAPRRKTRGGQHRYSDLAIETALTLGLVFGLRLRQARRLAGIGAASGPGACRARSYHPEPSGADMAIAQQTA